MTDRAPLLYLLNSELENRARGLLSAGVLRPTDLLLVDAVAPRFGEPAAEVLLGLAFAVRAPRAGHVGVVLPSIRGQVDDEGARWRSVLTPAEPDIALDWPKSPTSWEAAVLASPMVGAPFVSDRPFVCQALADGRKLVMTRRMWREQERLADAARALATGTPSLRLSDNAIAAGIARLFGRTDGQAAQAVSTAATRRLTVVTGGPGTGKTYCIKRLLALLIESATDATTDLNRPFRVELAAPTGKAAVRMAAAIAEDLEALDVADHVRDVLSNSRPRTLHKLLGMRPDGTCRHGLERPVSADLVVVDEASMVDLTLMRRLFEAIPSGARLVLLGDRDQLASVEAGTVLADFVAPVLDGSTTGDEPLHAAVVSFETNYRFNEAPTVAAIAGALKGTEDEQLERVVRWMSGVEIAAGEQLRDRITHLGIPVGGRPTERHLEALAAPYLDEQGLVGLLAASIRAHGASGLALQSRALHLRLLEALDDYRVLVVHRHGPLGVSGIEWAIESRCQDALRQAMRDHAHLPASSATKLPTRLGHWLGRPLLVTQNSYEVQLMNGDIGLVMQTTNGLAAVFKVTEDGVETTRELALSRLPDHMGAFAMTVHKSQGSQFRRVAVVLAGRDSPIQTRELVYTAITRTSSRLDWLGGAKELQRALRRRVDRTSGLRDLLWTP